MVYKQYPFWCEHKQKSYRCLSESLEFDEQIISFVYQRDYEPDPLPFSLRFWENSVFEFFTRTKRKAWFDNQKRNNSWFCIRFIQKNAKYQWLGPFNTPENARSFCQPVLLEGPCSDYTLKQRHAPWTPFSDMIDGPEDYCSLLLHLCWEDPPHSDFTQEINLLSDLLQPGPQFFGNCIHIDDPRARERKQLLQRFLFHKNFEHD